MTIRYPSNFYIYTIYSVNFKILHHILTAIEIYSINLQIGINSTEV